MNYTLLGILGYIVLQLVVGMLASRRIRTEDDYLLAGRRLGYGLTTFSLFATWFGAETCLGTASEVYQHGLAGCSTDPLGYTIPLLLMGLFLCRRLWDRQLTTLADIFRVRFSVGVERLAVLMMIPTSVFWAGAQIRAFGQVLSASSEMGVTIATTLSAIVVILYTISGGLLADVVTDLLQGIVLILGLLIVLAAVVLHAGGLTSAIQSIRPEQLVIFNTEESSWLKIANTWAIPIFGNLVIQELISRILATRSAVVAKRSALLAASLYLSVGLIPVLIALVGANLLPNLKDPEQFLPALVQQFTSPIIYVLFAGALVSAILSTVDSCLLAASALASQNLIFSFRPSLSEFAKVKISRLGVLLAGMIAYVLALTSEGVKELVVYSSEFGSAGIVVVVLFGLFSHYGRSLSAYAALLGGTASWAVASFAYQSPCPYLISLASAIMTYLLVAVIEHHGLQRVGHSRTMNSNG